MRIPSTTSGRTVTWVLGALALAGTPLLVAQQAAQQQDRPSFRSAARLVDLSVVVTGLTADDFQIFDEGKPLKVALFSVEGDSAAPPVSAVPPRHPREFSHAVAENPDAERLRIVVRDVRTGALGAIGVSRQQPQAIRY